jgi:hypothetical protein
VGAAEGTKDASVPSFSFDESREQRRERQRLDVSGVNASEQRLRHKGNRRRSEPSPKKTRDAFVTLRAALRNE